MVIEGSIRLEYLLEVISLKKLYQWSIFTFAFYVPKNNLLGSFPEDTLSSHAPLSQLIISLRVTEGVIIR